MSTKKSEKVKQWLKKWSIPLEVSFLIILFIAIYFSSRIIITIKPGEAGVLWSRFFGGTQVEDIYAEGIHFIFPWDKMYIYNIRLQTKEHELEVLTSRGLNVHLHLSIRYAPEYRFLGLLHQKVGPDYVNIVIIPEVTAVLRETIGTMNSEEIYTTGRKVITIAINEAIEQVEQRFIKVDDVLIKRIELPQTVADSIRYKIQQKHLIEAHGFIVEREIKEAERRRIEAKGVRDHLNIIAEALPDGKILTWMGINATEKLAHSNNAKIVLIGAGRNGLPLILNADNFGMPSPTLPTNILNQPDENKKTSPFHEPSLEIKSTLPNIPQLNPQHSPEKGIREPVNFMQTTDKKTP